MINISTKMSLTIVARARLHTAFLLTQRHCQCSPIGVGVSTPAPSIQTTPPKRPIEGSYNLKCYMSSFYLKMLLSASTPRDLLAGLREEKGTGTKKGETDGRQKAERQEMQTPTFYTRHPHIWFWVDHWRDRRSRTYVHKILQLQREAFSERQKIYMESVTTCSVYTVHDNRHQSDRHSVPASTQCTCSFNTHSSHFRPWFNIITVSRRCHVNMYPVKKPPKGGIITVAASPVSRPISVYSILPDIARCIDDMQDVKRLGGR